MASAPVAQTPEPQEASDGERASLKEKKLRLSQRWEAVVRSDDAKADQRRRSSRLVVTSAARQGVKEVASGFGTLGPPPRWLKPLVEAGANCDELVAALEAHDRELASTLTGARDAEDEARGATWLAGLRSAALETGRAEAEFGDVVVPRRDDDAAPAAAPAAAADEGAPAEADDDLAGAWDDVAAGERGGRLTPPPATATLTTTRRTRSRSGRRRCRRASRRPRRPRTKRCRLGPGRLLQCWMGCGGPFDFLKRGSPTPTRGATPASRASTPPVDYDAGAVADHWS
ncbi:hypothetical protein JL721_1970 [Aureococcus anophagefferens]|nr:hypothetical protein JL721_1970 [Aureococcus anophagefferens]